MEFALPPLDNLRYEILPFGSAEGEAATVAGSRTLTVTCSPKQGVDNSVEVACRLRELGHAVIVHIAARMVRSSAHIDSLLTRMSSGGVHDVFLIGGDVSEPVGPYDSALQLLPELRAHAKAPRTIGVAAYPEGHPLILGADLREALRRKDRQADYMTTQFCFDSEILLRWLERTREAGVQLPVYVGIPGAVDRRRLLEISVRVGVGASVSFIRKKRGVRRLLGRHLDATQALYSAVAPLIGGDLGVAGLHFYTFNRLVRTTEFVAGQAQRPATRPSPWGGVASPAMQQESKTT